MIRREPGVYLHLVRLRALVQKVLSARRLGETLCSTIFTPIA